MDLEDSLKCRICCEEKEENLLTLMNTLWDVGSTKSIKDIILFCVPNLTIQETSHLCTDCLQHLKSTYIFIKRCLKTEKRLVQEPSQNISDKLENILKDNIDNGKNIKIVFVNSVEDAVEDVKDVENLQDHTYFIRSQPEETLKISAYQEEKKDSSRTNSDITDLNLDNVIENSNDDIDTDDFDNNSVVDKDTFSNVETENNSSASNNKTNSPKEPFPKELLNMFDFVPDNVRCITIENDMSPDHQKALIQERVNILNMSSDVSKKKRIIYLVRNYEQCMRQCKSCDMIFYSRIDFLDHRHKHKGKKKKSRAFKYNCNLCIAKFLTARDYRAHHKEKHGILYPFYCSKCEKTFRNYKDMKDHETLFRDNDKCSVKCGKCDKEFATKRQLEIHEADVADAPCCNYYKCKECSVKFTREEFIIHSELHPNYLCSECGKIFLTSSSLHTHTKNVHLAQSSMCHECGKVYKSSTILQRHIEAEHSNDEFMCDQCPRTFKRKPYLRKHVMKVHLKVEHKNFTCDSCGKSFQEKFGLSSHKELVHEVRRKYFCPTCGEGFVRNDYLRRHILHHEKYMQHSCSLCKKSFPCESRLLKHRYLRHNEDADYRIRPLSGKRKFASTTPRICNICHKVLSNQNSLKSHYKSHLKIREYWCEKCQLTLQTYSAYRNHLMRHDNPNFEFSCNICHAYKSSRAELEAHLLHVHKNKKYSCRYCPMKFGRKHLLYNHESIKHQETNIKKENLYQILTHRKTKLVPNYQVKRTNKGVKLNHLNHSIDDVVKKILESEDDRDMMPLEDEQITNEEMEKDETINGELLTVDRNVDILSEEYEITQEELACNLLEEDMKNDM